MTSLQDHHQLNHERFKKHLSDSTPDVFRIGHFIHRKGLSIYIPGYKVANNLQEIDNNQDEGDLTFFCDGKKYITEVKATNTSDFTDTVKHKFSTFFVCAKHSFERYKKEKPSYYFILNASRTYTAIIDVQKTFDKWQVIETSDRRYVNYSQERYACPVDVVKIEKLD